jgi:quinoprotein glucose dehydrogenase
MIGVKMTGHTTGLYRNTHRLVSGQRIIVLILACLLSSQITPSQETSIKDGDWPAYGRDQGGSRYSPLTQINRVNVKQLKLAWTYRTGDVSDGKKTAGVKSAFEATPILVDGMLYLSTPFDRIIALDPETGAERWAYDPKIETSQHIAGSYVSRGVSTWLDPKASTAQSCRRRIFLGTLDARLIALDGATGKPCADFGDGGQVDLSKGVGDVQRTEYQVTSPPAVINDLVIVGSAIGDNQRVKETSGAVRAFDVRTGRLRWVWDPVPRNSSDPAAGTWKGDSASFSGAANVWSLISADPLRDLIFLPTTSPSPDYYGGERIGNNNYADSVVALRASTGKVVWHFQVVHHDLWDYDIPAQPALITVRRNGKEIPAVAVATKMGHLFFLNREDGKPLFPVEERSVPQTTVTGEVSSPTQPFPTSPRPLVPQKLTAEDAWGLTPAEREQCRTAISALRSEGIFTPPSLQGTLMFPGDVGGMNWSGVAFDARRGLLIANTNRLARVVTLIPRAGLDRAKLTALRAANPESEYSSQRGTPYLMRREWLMSATSLPCNAPPWGTLVAVDASTGAVRWEVPLGTMPELAKVAGSSEWGSLNLGGSIVTAGGLVFIAAARDDYLRAFDVETGKEVWKAALPAGGQATPMTYQLNKKSKQYIVIAAGGHGGLGTTLGDYVVAFTLQ